MPSQAVTTIKFHNIDDFGFKASFAALILVSIGMSVYTGYLFWTAPIPSINDCLAKTGAATSDKAAVNLCAAAIAQSEGSRQNNGYASMFSMVMGLLIGVSWLAKKFETKLDYYRLKYGFDKTLEDKVEHNQKKVDKISSGFERRVKREHLSL